MSYEAAMSLTLQTIMRGLVNHRCLLRPKTLFLVSKEILILRFTCRAIAITKQVYFQKGSRNRRYNYKRLEIPQKTWKYFVQILRPIYDRSV